MLTGDDDCDWNNKDGNQCDDDYDKNTNNKGRQSGILAVREKLREEVEPLSSLALFLPSSNIQTHKYTNTQIQKLTKVLF